MAKDIRPAWQQVLLVALQSVPKAKNGRDAWEKLNDEEKAAVMGFLTEYCGAENAQAALAVGWADRSPWDYRVWPGLVLMVAWIALVLLMAKCLGPVLNGFRAPAYIAMFLSELILDIRGVRRTRMIRCWNEREATLEGTTKALKDMYESTSMSKWKAGKWQLTRDIVLLALALCVLYSQLRMMK